MTATLEVLTLSESQALKAYESEIAPNVKAFIRVGKALMAIRDSRLYRTQFKSFEAYCAERWDISRTRAHQMIDAAHVCKNFEGLDVCPENEGQVRVLAKLPPEKQVEVFTRVAASGNVTAKKLEEALGGNNCERQTQSQESHAIAPEKFESIVEREATRLADLIEQFPDPQHLDVIDDNLKFLRGRIEELRQVKEAA